jgi:hypothetical protein
MNYILFIFFPISWYFFRKQEKKHRFERSLFYTYEQTQTQIDTPLRDILESILIVFVGATLLEIGVVVLWTATSLYFAQDNIIRSSKIVEEAISQQFFFATVLIGGGIAMMVLGVRSIIANKKYKNQLD